MNNPSGNPNQNFPPNYPGNNPNNLGNNRFGQQPMGPQNMGYPSNQPMGYPGNQQMGPQSKSNEFTSTLSATTTNSNSKPFVSYLYFITLRTCKKIGNYILLGIHLLLLLMILIIPKIMLEAGVFYSSNPIDVIHSYVVATKGCMLGAIVANALFLSIFSLKLTFSIFLSNKEDGTEILIVSKPITRNQILGNCEILEEIKF